jgi:hydrogenase maturation protease HycI
MEQTKTWQGTWKASLKLLLNQLETESGRSPKIAVLGIGNLLRSDDAAGNLVAGALSRCRCAKETERVLVIAAGPAPENSTGELRVFAPDLVLFVDAADMGEDPGAIRWIPEGDIAGLSTSTHSPPLSVLARDLRLELKCTGALLGIQPASNEAGERVTPEVWHAMHQVTDGLDELLSSPRLMEKNV